MSPPTIPLQEVYMLYLYHLQSLLTSYLLPLFPDTHSFFCSECSSWPVLLNQLLLVFPGQLADSPVLRSISQSLLSNWSVSLLSSCSFCHGTYHGVLELYTYTMLCPRACQSRTTNQVSYHFLVQAFSAWALCTLEIALSHSWESSCEVSHLLMINCLCLHSYRRPVWRLFPVSVSKQLPLQDYFSFYYLLLLLSVLHPFNVPGPFSSVTESMWCQSRPTTLLR